MEILYFKGVVCMSRKILLLAALALVLCFSIVFTSSAALPTAKDLVIANITNLELGVDKGFYEKSQDDTIVKLTEFDGSLFKELDLAKGDSVNFLSQLDSSNNVIKINFTTDIRGNKQNGSFYLKDDKIIFTKGIFLVLKDLGIGTFEEEPALLEQIPEYMYLSDEQLKSVWEQMTSYQNQQLPEEYKEILLFVFEAIPEQYVSLSSGKVTLKLDQEGMEDVIYNLLTKVKDEKERVAGLIVSLFKYNLEQMEMTPEQMKQDIISEIDRMPAVTSEQMVLLRIIVLVKDFT
jgi:hypothetical protein